MTHPCEIIADAAVGHSSFPTGRKTILAESMTATDGVIGQRATVWADHGHGTDTLTYKRVTTFGDNAHGIETYKPLNNARVVMADRGRMTQVFIVARSVNMSDTAIGTDTLTPVRGFVMKEAGHGIETYKPVGIRKMVMADIVKAVEKYTSARITVIADHAHGVEAYSTNRSTLMAEHAHGTPLFHAIGLLSMVIAEVAHGRDTVTNKVASIQLMAEEGCVEDTLVIPGSNAGLSTPTDNAGMSRYDGLLINSIAGSDVGLVGAGAAGIYAFDTPGLDVGAKYNAFVLTSVWDGGKATMKRYGYMYSGLSMVDATGLGPYDATSNPGGYRYALDVVDWQDGAPTTTTYLPEPGPIGGYVSRRHKVGRGRRSFYFQHRFHYDGLIFAADDLRGVVDLLTRKV